MKLKSFLIILILTVSSVYAKPQKKEFSPIYKDEYLLDKCKDYAKFLGYNENLIAEAHYVTLPDNILGRCMQNDKVILINRNYKFAGWWVFDETLIHEICHLYTTNDLEWHIAMVKAANKINWLEVDILEDEKRQHKLD